MLATIHGRDQIQDVEIAADARRARSLGLDVNIAEHGRLPAAPDAGRSRT